LDGANLTDADLSEADISGAHLDNAKLNNANLTGANLQDANLSNADMAHANLHLANFANALLDGANLTNADLSEVHWQNISIIGVTGLDDQKLATLFGVSVEQLPAALTGNRIRLEEGIRIKQALVDVCRGKGHPATAPYQPIEGFHPVVVLTESGEIKPEYDVDRYSLEPMALRYTQLVACLGEKINAVETCQYNVSTLTRRQWVTSALLVEAATGKTVTYKQFYGNPPGTCPDSKRVETRVLDGEKVAFTEVANWLERLVNAH
jgi:hypothetical protein